MGSCRPERWFTKTRKMVQKAQPLVFGQRNWNGGWRGLVSQGVLSPLHTHNGMCTPHSHIRQNPCEQGKLKANCIYGLKFHSANLIFLQLKEAH